MASILSPILKRCSSLNTDGYACYKLPVPAVVGIAVGSAVFLFILIALALLIWKLRRRRQKRKNGDQEATLRYLGAQKPEPIAFNPNAY